MTQTPKHKLKAGDPVMLPSGLVTELTDIQYEHNRYQLYAVSNWQYGIENLQPADWKAEALKWREEALRKYPTPEAYEAACAALEKHRARADEAEINRDKAYNMIGHKAQEISELRTAQGEAEAREQRLKEMVGIALGECKGEPDYFLAKKIRSVFATLYPDTPAPTPEIIARPIEEWHEDMGCVIWWEFPISEPPHCGTPMDIDWPGYHTHWTPIVIPAAPKEGTQNDEN